MTSIEYSEGPTVEQRQQFCNTNENGHIPGYMGYCPQLKYKYGRTFGNQTSKISKILPSVHSKNIKENSSRFVFNDADNALMLPKSTGDNKYTANMIPGYSGDVPHLKYKYGSTYKKICEESVDEFVRDYNYEHNKQLNLSKENYLKPELKAIACDPHVKQHMKIWTNNMLRNNTVTKPTKPSSEPPIPGYQGFIPRVENTEAGVGRRFHEAAHKGLKIFRKECDSHSSNLSCPINNTDKCPTYAIPKCMLDNLDKSDRIFHQEGMIPDYQGHMHGLKFEIGKGFGNATRDLDVCAHPFNHYTYCDLVE